MNSSEENGQILKMIGLYQEDPEAFEKMRTEIIHQVIESLPEEYRRRAYGMQFQLEMRLKRYRDPIDRMNAMISMFWEQFEEFNTVLNDPQRFFAERDAVRHAPAKVVSLDEHRSRQ